jgi:hypothetical protein
MQVAGVTIFDYQVTAMYEKEISKTNIFVWMTWHWDIGGKSGSELSLSVGSIKPAKVLSSYYFSHNFLVSNL